MKHSGPHLLDGASTVQELSVASDEVSLRRAGIRTQDKGTERGISNTTP